MTDSPFQVVGEGTATVHHPSCRAPRGDYPCICDRPQPVDAPLIRPIRAVRLANGQKFRRRDVPTVWGTALSIVRTRGGLIVDTRWADGTTARIELGYKDRLDVEDPTGTPITVNVTLLASIVSAWATMAAEHPNDMRLQHAADALANTWSDVLVVKEPMPYGYAAAIAEDLATQPGRDVYATTNPF